jgi:hypothetical protein
VTLLEDDSDDEVLSDLGSGKGNNKKGRKSEESASLSGSNKSGAGRKRKSGDLTVKGAEKNKESKKNKDKTNK